MDLTETYPGRGDRGKPGGDVGARDPDPVERGEEAFALEALEVFDDQISRGLEEVA